MSRSRRRGRNARRERAVDLERYRDIVDDWAAFTEAASRPEPTVFRVRSGRIEEAELIDRLRAQGFETRSLEGLPGFHQVVSGERALSATFEHWNGLLYVQQASTGVAAPAVGVRPGRRALDLCSAPGGKTTHLAELMEDRGCIVASEISEPRIRGLLGNIYRLGHPNILVVSGDGRDFPEGALFDHVLVDAPCSGEGTLRRRGGSVPYQSAGFQAYVTGAQRGLLEKAVRLVRPGGTVLYVTCTFAPEENEAVVSDALRDLPIDLEPLDLPVPHARGVTSFQGAEYDARVEGAARIYPHHLDSGGLFLAKLRRKEDGEAKGGYATGGDVAGSGDAGWTPVPRVFPDAEDSVEGPGGGSAGGAAPRGEEDGGGESAPVNHEGGIDGGVAEVRDRFGADAAMERVSWIARGGRLWMHGLDEWPLEAWEPGSWRAVSVGIRAIDFDSRGRARPTNDFLRLADVDLRQRWIAVEDDVLGRLLKREPVPVEIEERGPIAIRAMGAIVGRGAVTGEGLKSEIPKARAADLRRVLGEG